MDSPETRRKIVFLISSLEGGGAERVFVTLLRHLDRRYFDLHLVLLRVEGEFVCQVPTDVTVHTLNGVRNPRTLFGFVSLTWRLVRLLRKIYPHTILSTGGMNLALALVRPLLPRTSRVLIRECSVLSARIKSDTRYPHLWRRVYRHVYRLADKVVCHSDFMVREMTEQFHLPQHASVRIYNPIDVDCVRASAKIGGNPFVGPGPQLVAAGRLSNEKGFDLLLAAMPRVIEYFPNVRLTILGQGPLRGLLTQQVEKLGLTGYVDLPGFQQNPWPYFSHADLFVLSSRRESFSNVLLETLALETPAVAVDCPGAIRELYGGNPSVSLVPAGDSAVLADAIIETCETKKVERINSGTSPEWLAKFALPKIMGEYKALFLG